MKLDKKYFFVTVFLFLIELYIAIFIKDKFIRPFLGDVLVVVLLFSFFRVFYKGKRLKLIFGILIFSFVIEFSQYFQIVKILNLENNKFIKTILGATFDWLDLLAYIVGAIFSYCMDYIINNQLNQR